MPAKTKGRFRILMSPLWRPLLIPFGATPDNCFVDIVDGKLRVRFGRLVDQRFPLDEVETVMTSHWPLWAGIGPRYFRGTVGLVGTYVNTVEIRFKEPQRMRMLVPLQCRRLFVSIEEPHAFLAAFEKRPLVEAKKAA